jgi:hypothetical protein
MSTPFFRWAHGIGCIPDVRWNIRWAGRAIAKFEKPPIARFQSSGRTGHKVADVSIHRLQTPPASLSSLVWLVQTVWQLQFEGVEHFSLLAPLALRASGLPCSSFQSEAVAACSSNVILILLQNNRLSGTEERHTPWPYANPVRETLSSVVCVQSSLLGDHPAAPPIAYIFCER